jgi:hypothetical protein
MSSESPAYLTSSSSFASFLLGVGRHDLQAALADHPAHAAEFLVRQDRGALQRLAQRLALGLQLVLVAGRDDARVVRELAVDQLGTSSIAPKLNAAWVARARCSLVVAVGEQLGELEHGLARHDHFLARQSAAELHRGVSQPVAVGRDQLQLLSSTTISRPFR